MITSISGGNYGKSSAPKEKPIPVAEDSYGAQIIGIKEIEQEDYDDKSKKVKKIVITVAITDGDKDNVYNPRYTFMHNEEDPNWYGRKIQLYLNPKLNNGEQGLQSDLHRLYVAVVRGRVDAEGNSLDGKPMTEAEIKRIMKEPNLLTSDLVGKRLKVAVGITQSGGNKVTSWIAATPKVKPYVEPVYKLTPQQEADVTDLVYADTGERVIGYHRKNRDGVWEYVSAQAAADASVSNYGFIYSPKKQWELKEAGQRRASATGQARPASADTDDVPF